MVCFSRLRTFGLLIWDGYLGWNCWVNTLLPLGLYSYLIYTLSRTPSVFLLLSLIAMQLLHLPVKSHFTLISNSYPHPQSIHTCSIILLILIWPTVTLIFRPSLFGYASRVVGTTGGYGWDLHTWIWTLLATWFWDWAVERRIMSTSCSSVVSSFWFFFHNSFLANMTTNVNTHHSRCARAKALV